MNKDYKHLFKFVLIGNQNVGKSSLLLRFSNDVFNEENQVTIYDFVKLQQILKRNSKQYLQRVNNWDTAGAEKFRTLTSSYYKGADGFIMVYDSQNKQSFEDLELYWQFEIEKHVGQGIPILLLANKSDQQSKVISKEQAIQFADRNKYQFFETSAKTGFNVEQAFFQFALKILNKKKEIKAINNNCIKQNQDNFNNYKNTNSVMQTNITPREDNIHDQPNNINIQSIDQSRVQKGKKKKCC